MTPEEKLKDRIETLVEKTLNFLPTMMTYSLKKYTSHFADAIIKMSKEYVDEKLALSKNTISVRTE
jgi:hypothetical protein